MDFRNLTVKELFDNPDTAAVIKELAPQLLKYPIKLLGKKKCGEIFDKVVATGRLTNWPIQPGVMTPSVLNSMCLIFLLPTPKKSSKKAFAYM